MNVKELADGKVLMICRVGCSNADIVEALGVHWSALFPESDTGRSTYADYRREAQRITAQDVLAALAFELEISRIALADMIAGRPMSDVDRARYLLALKRIEAAIRISRGEH